MARTDNVAVYWIVGWFDGRSDRVRAFIHKINAEKLMARLTAPYTKPRLIECRHVVRKG